MMIVVTCTDSQWEELHKQPGVEWQRVDSADEFNDNQTADAFFNLKEDAHLYNYALLDKPILINSVTTTLQQMKAPSNIFRLNGWTGFLSRPVWEIAGLFTENMNAIFNGIQKKISIVKDEPGFIAARIIAMIINEAYFALGDNVSTREEVDIAMKLGTNYPFGPFEWAQAIGEKNILQLLQQLSTTDGRYQPAPLLLASVNNK